MFKARVSHPIGYFISELHNLYSFSVAGPVGWNSLPAVVRHDNWRSFKRRFKSNFFKFVF